MEPIDRKKQRSMTRECYFNLTFSFALNPEKMKIKSNMFFSEMHHRQMTTTIQAKAITRMGPVRAIHRVMKIKKTNRSPIGV